MSDKKNKHEPTGGKAANPSEEETFEQAQNARAAESPSGEAPDAPKVDKPADPVADLQAKVDESQDKYLRLMAEFDNFRRRTAREHESRSELACESIIVDMIEVRDNFERALKASKQNADPAVLLDGMRLIFDKFDSILSRNGLVPFGEVGEEFSPEIYDALMKVHHAEIPADHITDVFEHGYRLKNKVVKHGRVIVSSGKSEGESKNSASDPKDNEQERAASEAA